MSYCFTTTTSCQKIHSPNGHVAQTQKATTLIYDHCIYRMNASARVHAQFVRSAVTAVAVEVEKHDRRLSLDELLSICAAVRPSTKSMYSFVVFCCPCSNYQPYVCTVTIGGELFEYYIYACGGYAVKRRLDEVMRNTNQNNSISPIEQQQFIEECGIKFMGWLLCHMASIGSNGRTQMFYITFLLHYYGVSRDGIKHLHNHGLGMGLTAFDEMKANYALRSTTKLRYGTNSM
jgi:hypothetical protein